MAKKPDDYNPHYNPGERNADNLFGQENGLGRPSSSAPGFEAPQEDIRNQEQNPNHSWKNKVSNIPDLTHKTKQGRKLWRKQLWKAIVKRKFALVGGTTLAGGGASVLLFGGIIGTPIGIIQTVVGDLDDLGPIATVRAKLHLRNRMIPSKERSKAIKGCKKFSLSKRCKFATVSDAQRERLKQAGIEIQVDERKSARKFGTRVVPSGYSFRGKDYNAQEWNKMLRENPDARKAQLRANNMKKLPFKSTRFGRFVKARLGLKGKPPGLKGSKQDRINQILNVSGTTDIKDVKLIPGGTDEKGNKYWVIEGQDGQPRANSPRYNEAQKNKFIKEQPKLAKVAARSAGKLGSAGLKGLSVLGALDIACTIRNMFTGAVLVAKFASSQAQMKYAWNILTRSGQLMNMFNVLVPVVAAMTFLSTLTEVDRRDKVLDEAKTAISGKEVYKKNPNFGKSALDSSLISLSVSGNFQRTEQNKLFMAGGNMATLAGGIAQGGADILKTIAGLDDKTCSFIQNPLTRVGGVAVSVALGVFTLGAGTAVQLAVTAGMMAAMIAFDYWLNSAIKSPNTSILEDPNEKVARGDLFWTGTSGIMGKAAQISGMVPATKEQIIEQRLDSRAIQKEYLAMERSSVNPLDIRSPGSSINQLAIAINQEIQPLSKAESIFQAPSIIVKSLLRTSPSALALEDSTRFGRMCGDKAYERMTIAADVQCNLRYTIPKEDLELDPFEVQDYMENKGCGGNGCVDKNTTDGLPPGYKPPTAEESSNAIMNAIGTALGMARDFLIGDYISDKNVINDYGSFLEYCTFRDLPFGDTQRESTIGDASHDWRTGKNCMKKGAPYSYYRVYTLDNAVQESLDASASDEKALDTTAALSSTPSESSGGVDDTPSIWQQKASTDPFQGTSWDQMPDNTVGQDWLGMFPGQCAAFAAWRFAQQWYGDKLKPDGSNWEQLINSNPPIPGRTMNYGDGKQMADILISNGVATRVDINEAQPGDIVSAAGNPKNKAGHVYVVTSRSEGRIYIEDYNRVAHGTYGTSSFALNNINVPFGPIQAVARVKKGGGA